MLEKDSPMQKNMQEEETTGLIIGAEKEKEKQGKTEQRVISFWMKPTKNLESLKVAIENEDGKKLEEIFEKTKKIRKEILKSGQDTNKPDFGR